MTLTMDFSATLDAFTTPLAVYVDDMEGTYENPETPGEWIWSEPKRRTLADGITPKAIRAIMLALSVQTLFFYKEGNVSDGGIALLTQEQLYFTNIHQPAKELNKQSLVIYQDRRFRVVGDGFISNWTSLVGNANFHCYHCLRYVE